MERIKVTLSELNEILENCGNHYKYDKGRTILGTYACLSLLTIAKAEGNQTFSKTPADFAEDLKKAVAETRASALDVIFLKNELCTAKQAYIIANIMDLASLVLEDIEKESPFPMVFEFSSEDVRDVFRHFDKHFDEKNVSIPKNKLS